MKIYAIVFPSNASPFVISQKSEGLLLHDLNTKHENHTFHILTQEQVEAIQRDIIIESHEHVPEWSSIRPLTSSRWSITCTGCRKSGIIIVSKDVISWDP